MAGRRRIVYQLVAPMEKTLGVAEIERRRDYLRRHAGAGTEITVQSVPSGYASIESERDAVMVAPHLHAWPAQSRSRWCQRRHRRLLLRSGARCHPRDSERCPSSGRVSRR